MQKSRHPARTDQRNDFIRAGFNQPISARFYAAVSFSRRSDYVREPVGESAEAAARNVIRERGGTLSDSGRLFRLKSGLPPCRPTHPDHSLARFAASQAATNGSLADQFLDLAQLLLNDTSHFFDSASASRSGS